MAKKKLTNEQREQRRQYQRARYARLHGKKPSTVLNAPAQKNGNHAPGPNELIQSYARVIRHTTDKKLREQLITTFVDLVDKTG